MAERLKAQGDRSVVVGRDAINSIINTGDHVQLFVGDYERLRDAYIEPWSVFERVDLDHFVGREWLTAEVDAFLRDHDRGYFILEAEAGLGKTTFLAWLVRERGYIHHFTELAPGLNGVGRGLKNLAAQLVLAYHLSAWEAEGVLPGAAARPDYLSRLLKLAADQRQGGEKLVLVVDALDEAGTPPSQNVLGLPQVLPDGVFLIVSQRPVPVTLHVDTASTPRRCFALAAASDENQADMRCFLQRVVTWPGVAQALGESDITPDVFTTTLLEKCRGMWIYLHYVVHEIERGERSPRDLDALPDGVTQYYARYWKRWRDQDEHKWYEVYLPLLSTLAAAQEAVTAERLAEWTDVKLPPPQLRRLLNERWRPFLAPTGQRGQVGYRLYHATLREFFEGGVERDTLKPAAEASLLDELVGATRQAHNRLVERYLDAWGGLEKGLPGLGEATRRDIDKGYALRHLAAHLEVAGRVEDLHRLLAVETGEERNAWYEAKEAVGDIEGYLADARRAWWLGVRIVDIGMQIRYALCHSSVVSLSANVPVALLALGIENGLFFPAQALCLVQHNPTEWDRVRALGALAPVLSSRGPVLMEEALAVARGVGSAQGRAEALISPALHLPEASRERVLQEALAATREIVDERMRGRVLSVLVPCLQEPLRAQTLEDAYAIAWETGWVDARANVLCNLAPYLSEELLTEALAWAQKPADTEYIENYRATVLSELVPYLPETLREQILDGTLATVRKIKDNWLRALELTKLVPYLPEVLRAEILGEALAAARGAVHEHPDAGVEELMKVALHLPKAQRERVLKEALAATQQIGEKTGRIAARVRLVPHLPAELRERALAEALTEAKDIGDALDRVRGLCKVAPHLPEPIRDQVIREALGAAREIGDADDRALALSTLAPHLAELFSEESLAAAREIGKDELRARVLSGLVPHLPATLRDQALEEALAAARDLDWWKPERVDVLNGLIPYLPEELRERMLAEALATAQNLPFVGTRGNLKWIRALNGLVPYLPKERLGEALVVAQGITDESARAEALSGLAPRLSEKLLENALSVAKEIVDERSRAKALAGIAPFLPRKLLAGALSVACAIKGAEGRAEALIGVALYLPDTQKKKMLLETLTVVRETGVYKRRLLLSRLAPHLSAHLRKQVLAEALTLARREWNDADRAQALAKLVPHLPQPLQDEVLQEALAAVQETSKQRSDKGAWTLADLAPYFPEGMLAEALAVARELPVRNSGDRSPRAYALAGLIPHLITLPNNVLYSRWCETLPHLAQSTRRDLLADLGSLTPIIAGLGGADALAETYCAIQDVGRWWP